MVCVVNKTGDYQRFNVPYTNYCSIFSCFELRDISPDNFSFINVLLAEKAAFCGQWVIERVVLHTPQQNEELSFRRCLWLWHLLRRKLDGSVSRRWKKWTFRHYTRWQYCRPVVFSLRNLENHCLGVLGSVSRKSPKNSFGSETRFRVFWKKKRDLFTCFNVRKIKRIAKFHGFEPRRCEDIRAELWHLK